MNRCFDSPDSKTESPPSPVAAVLCLRSEEHTSELQSRLHLVCRLLLEKKKNNISSPTHSNQDLPQSSLGASKHYQYTPAVTARPRVGSLCHHQAMRPTNHTLSHLHQIR